METFNCNRNTTSNNLVVNTKLIQRMLRLLLLLTIFSFVSCTSEDSSTKSEVEKSPDELKLELEMNEQSNPTQYLSIDSEKMKRNLVREKGFLRNAQYDGWIIEGFIRNSATIARYKDVVLTIQFHSQTGTVIEERDHPIYEYFEPGAFKHFKVKLYPPDATEKFSVSVKSAVAAN